MLNRKMMHTVIVFSLFVITAGSLPLLAHGQSTLAQGKTTAVKWIDDNASSLKDISGKIWEYSEMGLKEFKSSDLLVSQLEKNGFKVERGQGGMPTAFVGTYVRGTGKPVIGFLAEFDALPNGHSCGHNLYGTGSVSAAIATKEAMERNNIDGTLKLFGTPTEDTHGGKVWMAREHVFDGCDAMLAWHPGFENKSNYGSNLAVQILEVTFTGKSSHAGQAPEKGRSALDGLMIASMSMEFLREHMIEPMRIQYIVSNGGQAPNIVPDYAQLKLVIRGPTMKDIEDLRSRDGGVDDCVRAGALGSGTDVTLQVVGAFYNQLPNKAGSYLLYENMKAVGAPTFTGGEQEIAKSVAKKYNLPLGKLDNTIFEPKVVMEKASADTGDVSYVAPLLTVTASCAAIDSPGHSQANRDQYGTSIGQKGMIFAGKVLAVTALDLLADAAKLEAITKDFRENIKGKDYHAVIPADLWPPIPDKNPADFKGPAPQLYPKPKASESILYWKKK